jgi:hypothetical protein
VAVAVTCSFQSRPNPLTAVLESISSVSSIKHSGKLLLRHRQPVTNDNYTDATHNHSTQETRVDADSGGK